MSKPHTHSMFHTPAAQFSQIEAHLLSTLRTAVLLSRNRTVRARELTLTKGIAQRTAALLLDLHNLRNRIVSPRQRVLSKHPGALCQRFCRCSRNRCDRRYAVWACASRLRKMSEHERLRSIITDSLRTDGGDGLGTGSTAARAWAEAAAALDRPVHREVMAVRQ